MKPIYDLPLHTIGYMTLASFADSIGIPTERIYAMVYSGHIPNKYIKQQNVCGKVKFFIKKDAVKLFKRGKHGR